jgi:hypothetical protein
MKMNPLACPSLAKNPGQYENDNGTSRCEGIESELSETVR